MNDETIKYVDYAIQKLAEDASNKRITASGRAETARALAELLRAMAFVRTQRP